MVTLEFHRMSLPFRTEFSLAGTHCFLSTNSHELLRLSRQWQSLPARPDAGSFRMSILEEASVCSDQPKPSHFRGLGHLVFALLEPKTFLTFDLLRSSVFGVISPAAAKDAYFWNVQLLPIALGLLGTTVGVAPLHCACLDRSGSGLLVAGDSGSGKSTLTTALAKRGWAVVSDDWTYVSYRPGKLIAHGMYAPIKLLPDSIRYFPELRRNTPKKTLNGEVAYEVNAGKLFHSPVKACSAPKWLLSLERTSAPGCHFVPCRPGHATQYFEKNAEKLPAELPEAAQARSVIIQQVSKCQSWILRTGDDPIQTAQAVEKFLLEA
jgi:hypothetical protein